MLQVAKKASVLKRRKSRNKMEPPSQSTTGSTAECNNAITGSSTRRESEGDVVFYIEEPKAGKLHILFILYFYFISIKR